MKWLRELFSKPKPCELCHLGQSRWSSEHTGVAEWKFEGPVSRNTLIVCRVCREYLIETELLLANPMFVLARLVAEGRTTRVAPWHFLRHPMWLHIWRQILLERRIQITDLSNGFGAIAQVAEELYREAGYRPPDPHKPKLDANGQVDFGVAMRQLMKTHGIPVDIVERKYTSYYATLKAMDRSSNWNADIDRDAQRCGALSHKEVQAARTDLHKAVLNRVKLALHMEGFLSPTDQYEVGPELTQLALNNRIPLEVIHRKYIAYSVTLRAVGAKTSHWNDDIDDYARSLSVLSEQEIEAAHTDFHQAIRNRIKLALVAEGLVSHPVAPSGTDQEDAVYLPLFDPTKAREFKEGIAIPGSSPQFRIPFVSLAEAASHEYEQLYLTACLGAANILVALILKRTNGAIELPLARECALSLVTEGVETKLAPSRDTQGFFSAGRTLFETRWVQWSKTGNAVGALRSEYGHLLEED